MRKLKYIKPFLIFLFVGLGYYSFIKQKDSTTLIIIITFLALLVQLLEKSWIKRQIRFNNLIQINHPEQNKLKKILITLFTSGLTTTFIILIYQKEEAELTNIVLLIALFLISEFSTLFGQEVAFYIDYRGLVQPELLKQNISWDNLKNFNIMKNQINFNYQNKDYTFNIDKNASEKVKTWYNTSVISKAFVPSVLLINFIG